MQVAQALRAAFLFVRVTTHSLDVSDRDRSAVVGYDRKTENCLLPKLAHILSSNLVRV